MCDFRSMYKNVNQLKEHQIERRIRLLEAQRKKREDKFAIQRDLKDILRPKSKTFNFDKTFRNILMLSEWMMTKPENIEDYLLVPCPKGIRCSLSTGDDKNKAASLYYKNGQKFLEIKTNLPVYTILDCVYNKELQIVHVLDAIAFGCRDLIDCDASFRFFWLKSKFDEDCIRTTDSDSKLQLQLLNNYDFNDPYAIRTCFQTHPLFKEGAELDGYLFYHKDGLYTAGSTPLVLWLFPFMVDELFDTYKVDPFYHSEKPEAYSNYLDFIREFDEQLKNRKKKVTSKIKVEAEQETMDVIESSFDESRDEMQAMIELEMTGNDV